ncbi:MAG: PEP-CTERM sorting domain-containing protein [Chthoniobacterales bacterium]
MKKFYLPLIVCTFAALINVNAANVFDVAEHYSGSTSGNVDWFQVTPSAAWTYDSSGFGGPWTGGAFNPNNNTTVGSQTATTVNVNVAPTLTGDLTLTTSGAVTVQNINLNPIVGSNVFTLKLGGNFTQNATTAALTSITGASADASKLVIDLNGYNMLINRGNTGNTAASSFTLNSTNAGGVFTTAVALTGSGAERLAINDGATLFTGWLQGNTAGVATFYTYNTAMSANSTLKFAGRTAGTSIVVRSSVGGSLNQSFGNIIVGDGTTVTPWNFTGSWTGAPSTPLGRLMTVRGNFTLATNSSYTIGNINSTQGIAGIAVGGNYTDTNTGARTYSTATISGAINSAIFFNGGYTSGTPLVNERTVIINGSIGKNATSNLVTNFQVGDGSTGGNIKLGANLTLTDTTNFTVTNNSRLNLATYTLSTAAGGINIATGATIADSFGAASGLATTSGLLTLNSFNLQLNFDGTSWTNGTNLVLFNYNTISGTPTLGTVTFNTGMWTYGFSSLGGVVQLTNLTMATIPEPSSAALLLGAVGGLLVWTVRRKNRKNI